MCRRWCETQCADAGVRLTVYEVAGGVGVECSQLPCLHNGLHYGGQGVGGGEGDGGGGRSREEAGHTIVHTHNSSTV